jgi:hypothetical protein
MGKVGLLLGLRSETAPVVRHQPGAPLLRTHSGKRSGHLPERISLSEELIDETALGEGVARKLLGDLAYRSEDLREALAEVGILLATERAERRHGVRQLNRDRSFEPQEGLWVGRDFGYHARWVGYQDRGQDSSLHLRLCGQQDVGTPSRSHQGVVGMNLATHI